VGICRLTAGSVPNAWELTPSLDVDPAAAAQREKLPSVALLRGSAWVLAGRIAGRAIALVSGVVLARLLTPTNLGDFYLAFSLATLGAVVGRLGMDTAATRLVAESLAERKPSRARSVFRQTLAFSALGAGVVGAISSLGGWSWLAHHAFGNHRLAGVMVAATVLIVCEALQGTLVSWFRGLQVMRLVVLFDELVPGGAFLVLLVAVWLVSGHVGVAGALEMRAGGFALAILGVAVAMRGRLPALRGTGGVPRRQVAELGVTMTGAVLITAAVGSTSDLLVLGAFRPARDVAAYGIAVSVALLLAMPYLAMTTALGPQLAQLNARGERRRMEDLIRGAATIFGAATVAATALVVALARPILTVVFGGGYGRADHVLMVLALAQAAFVITGPCGLALTMTGYHRPAFVLTAMAAIASVGADVWAAPRYGALGVAVASSPAVVLDNVLTVLLARRLVGVWTLPRFRVEDLRLAFDVIRRTAGGDRRPRGATS
jgi:O-antigen/teichoic acid export membrane protein